MRRLRGADRYSTYDLIIWGPLGDVLLLYELGNLA